MWTVCSLGNTGLMSWVLFWDCNIARLDIGRESVWLRAAAIEKRVQKSV